MTNRTILIALVVSAIAFTLPASATERFITVASTTSTQNSGLYEHILPNFTTRTGIAVRIVAVGTGQAIKLARNGDADVLFVHHKASEERFVADGFGVERFDVMYNDFVLVGPKADPAGVRDAADTSDALARIAAANSPFTSRGDNSGTHKKERELWQVAEVDVSTQSGSWYRETGSGMGATLNTAAGMDAYALTDRATWFKFKNRGTLEILAEDDERMFNQYGVILVNPARHPHIKHDLGQAFIDWLLSKDGQSAIGAYRLEGQQAFFPNAAAGGS
ncbi:MAG: substrate-binding domain-containing protein [Pseudomonadota bacterium]|nr:substrate-binding domain-containing protein [Pseudomonadota bacterium]